MVAFNGVIWVSINLRRIASADVESAKIICFNRLIEDAIELIVEVAAKESSRYGRAPRALVGRSSLPPDATTGGAASRDVTGEKFSFNFSGNEEMVSRFSRVWTVSSVSNGSWVKVLPLLLRKNISNVSIRAKGASSGLLRCPNPLEI